MEGALAIPDGGGNFLSLLISIVDMFEYGLLF